MATIDTAKATTLATARQAQAERGTDMPVSDTYSKNPSPLIRLAPAIAGLPRKNENSAAASREIPMHLEPRMVEPERDVPGIMESA